MGEAVALFSGGVVALTLGEYTVHRFLLHNIATTQHRIHHAHPDEAIDKIFWQIWVCFAAVYLIAGGVVLAGALAPMLGIYLSITAPIIVLIFCRLPY
jgi:surface polysaccharide O-acyltransferase-like enzyme